jgi:hypothetical protein
MMVPMGESAFDAETLGALLMRLAHRVGYDGPSAYCYVVARLGTGLAAALMHERLPTDWSGCQALAARHGLDVAALWDLLLEDRPAG